MAAETDNHPGISPAGTHGHYFLSGSPQDGEPHVRSVSGAFSGSVISASCDALRHKFMTYHLTTQPRLTLQFISVECHTINITIAQIQHTLLEAKSELNQLRLMSLSHILQPLDYIILVMNCLLLLSFQNLLKRLPQMR